MVSPDSLTVWYLPRQPNGRRTSAFGREAKVRSWRMHDAGKVIASLAEAIMHDVAELHSAWVAHEARAHLVHRICDRYPAFDVRAGE